MLLELGLLALGEDAIACVCAGMDGGTHIRKSVPGYTTGALVSFPDGQPGVKR